MFDRNVSGEITGSFSADPSAFVGLISEEDYELELVYSLSWTRWQRFVNFLRRIFSFGAVPRLPDSESVKMPVKIDGVHSHDGVLTAYFRGTGDAEFIAKYE